MEFRFFSSLVSQGNKMASKQGVGFIKKLWAEKPDIAGSLCIALVGLSGLVVGYFKYDKDIDHQHRWKYTVIRKNDAQPQSAEKGIYN